MAIDRTGITSLNAGAGEITYSGNQGPKSPDQQLMAQADPMVVEMYQQYVFEMEEQECNQCHLENFFNRLWQNQEWPKVEELVIKEVN
jgi:hypothetical protein